MNESDFINFGASCWRLSLYLMTATAIAQLCRPDTDAFFSKAVWFWTMFFLTTVACVRGIVDVIRRRKSVVPACFVMALWIVATGLMFHVHVTQGRDMTAGQLIRFKAAVWFSLFVGIAQLVSEPDQPR